MCVYISEWFRNSIKIKIQKCTLLSIDSNVHFFHSSNQTKNQTPICTISRTLYNYIKDIIKKERVRCFIGT